jgi:hypothetical protein
MAASTPTKTNDARAVPSGAPPEMSPEPMLTMTGRNTPTTVNVMRLARRRVSRHQ